MDVEHARQTLKLALVDRPWFVCVGNGGVNGGRCLFVFVEGEVPPDGVPPTWQGWPVVVRRMPGAGRGRLAE